MAQLRLEINDTLKDDIQSYADSYGVSLAAAVRILLRHALDREGPCPVCGRTEHDPQRRVPQDGAGAGGGLSDGDPGG